MTVFQCLQKTPPKVLIGNPNIVSNKIFKQTIKWVQINKNVLLYYWQHPDMDIDDLLDRIKKITNRIY